MHNLAVDYEEEGHPNKGKYEFTFVNRDLEPLLTDTYNAILNPHIFVLDPETQKAYSWDGVKDSSHFDDWLLKKEYLQSKFQFKVPRIINEAEVIAKD